MFDSCYIHEIKRQCRLGVTGLAVAAGLTVTKARLEEESGVRSPPSKQEVEGVVSEKLGRNDSKFRGHRRSPHSPFCGLEETAHISRLATANGIGSEFPSTFWKKHALDIISEE